MTDEPTGGIEHTVSQGDVSVHRAIETDGAGIIGTIELSSAAAEPVLVEVAEELPDDLPVESAGFKPEAMPDGKEVTDDRLVLEQAVDDGPEEVVYGVMLSEPVETVSLDPPVVETVEPVAAGAAAAEDGSAAPPGDAGAEGTDPEEPATDAGADGDADAGDDPPSLSLSEPTDLGDDGADDTEGEPTGAADGPEVPELSTAAGPESPDADGGDGPAGRRSVDIRLDRLSARVEEFAAYAESLGTLVDEHGTPDEFVDRFDERIDAVDDRVASARAELSEEVDGVRADVGEVEGTVDAVEDDVESVAADVDSLDEELAALREDLDDVSATMEQVREETATLREELRELKAVRGSLRDVLGEWASADSGAESAPGADSGSDDRSVASDGGATDDDADEYTPAVTPVEPDQ